MQDIDAAIAGYAQSSGANPKFLEEAIIRVASALAQKQIVHHAKRVSIFRGINEDSGISKKNTKGQAALMAWLVAHCGIDAKPRSGGFVAAGHVENPTGCYAMIQEMLSAGKHALSVNDISRLIDTKNPTISSIHIGMVWDGNDKTKTAIKAIYDNWKAAPLAVIKANKDAKKAGKKSRFDRDVAALLKKGDLTTDTAMLRQRVANRRMAKAIGIDA